MVDMLLLIGRILLPVFTESIHQERDTEKSGIKTAMIFLNQLTQVIRHFGTDFLRNQVIFQGDHINPLKIRVNPSIFMHIFLYKCLPDLLI